MRAIIKIILVIVAVGIIACSQTKMPEKVTSAFAEKFPAAANVEWSKESDTEYEANFTIDSVAVAACFNIDGSWLETETTITKSDLPDTVVAVLDSQFVDSTIKTIESVEKAGEAVVYEVQLMQGESGVEVVFAEDGTVIKQEAMTVESVEKEGEEQAAVETENK